MDGIVLAAGYSSRAETNKMMLQYKGKPLIEHAITLLSAYCDRVIVVTGHYHNEMKSFLTKLPKVDVAYNRNYSNGMFSSILVGVGKTKGDFMILPGDVPTIQPETIEKVLSGTQNIRVPSFNHRLGHPIYFHKEYRDLLLQTSFDNLKSFRNQYAFEIIEVNDPGILKDVDRLADYHTLP